ncbi:MAG: uroporphyrinogen-III C-methyltransferase [Alphaproteobacteria bacterium]|nr:uroporphyrinogen-III C-methyltransferase [Alphaproteobacteria bacterium]
MPKSDRPVVYLVGAGPGDPDLLTVKAQRLLQSAQVVIYDRLVAVEILDLVPAGAIRIFAGKAQGRHSMCQEDINATLARLARHDRIVVRLKGGDPLIFGRGSEEAEYLVRRGIAVEVVPGITAASGCAAGVGIPLTHRGYATGVRFVTGHCRDDRDLDLNWRSLADPETTLVVYMGLSNAKQISGGLIAEGMPGDIPAAAIANGTTPQEQVVVSTLEHLAADIESAGIAAPALLVIGHVVAFARNSDLAATWLPLPDMLMAEAGRA